MSKLMNREQMLLDPKEWKQKQRKLVTQAIILFKKAQKNTDALNNDVPELEEVLPQEWIDKETNKPSRWLQSKSFSNYDETRFGPDKIDTVIDRLGIFEGMDFTSDIKAAEESTFGPTTLIDRTGTPEYRKKSSHHYPHAMVNDAEKIGVNLDELVMFDSSVGGRCCQLISNFIGLNYNTAQRGAQRDYGYDSLHIQRPGHMLMYHHDLYYAIIRDKDPELGWKPEKLRRFVVFLEDWKPGHVWIVGNTHFSHWRAGECISWNWQDMPHGTANLGMQPRYSLHLTGYMTPKSYNFYSKSNKNMRFVLNNNNSFDCYRQQGKRRIKVMDFESLKK